MSTLLMQLQPWSPSAELSGCRASYQLCRSHWLSPWWHWCDFCQKSDSRPTHHCSPYWPLGADALTASHLLNEFCGSSAPCIRILNSAQQQLNADSCRALIHCSCCQVTYARLGSIATRFQFAVRLQLLHLLIFRTCAAAMESILCIIQARCIDRHLLGCNRCE